MFDYNPEDFLRRGRFSGEAITSPYDLCNNEYLRQVAAGEFDWGEGVPTDVFVWAEGEPEDRSVTKTGGLPYRPAGEPWPVDDEGDPRLFVAQINFTESKDITGELPGDILLVFAKCDRSWFEELTFEWRSLTSESLITAEEIPFHKDAFTPTYGYRCRTMNYPNAKPLFQGKYPQLAGYEIWREYCLPCYQATQICRSPFFIHSENSGVSDDVAKALPLCVISSVQPAFDSPFPWVNQEEPIPLGHLRKTGKRHLMITDMGCLYIFMDDIQQLSWSEESY